MGISIKPKYSKFKLFMFTYWTMMLSISGMYTMYIVEAGFSKKEISFAVTLFTVSTLIGQNILGFITDHFQSVKKVLLASICLGHAATVVFIHSTQNLHIYLLICLWGFFLYSTVPLSEAWYIGVLKANGDQQDFGKIRGLGSVGYALSGVLLGLLLETFGWSIYIWYILISASFLLVIILMIAEDNSVALYKISGSKGDAGDVTFRKALKEMMRIKPLRSIILIIFLYSFVMKGIYSYLGVLVSDFGGGPFNLGLTYFFDAFPEIFTFYLATRLLRKYSSKKLILAAFILQIVRLGLILVFKSALSIILLGSLAGFAYGLLAAAYKTYIYELAPENYKVSCLSISESIIGLSGVVSAPVFGVIIMNFSGYASIAAGLVIYCAVALFMSINLYREKSSVS